MRNLRMISLAKIFEDSRRAADFVGPKYPQPFAQELIHHASSQRIIRADHGEIDARLLGETQQPREIIHGHRNVLAHQRSSGISWGAKNLRDAW